jgi:polyhydroxyalkanoate synthesis regulator phasin
MPIEPPGTEPAALIAFSLVESLLRRLVEQETLAPEEAADMLADIIAEIKLANLSGAEAAIPVLEEMLQEYRRRVR